MKILTTSFMVTTLFFVLSFAQVSTLNGQSGRNPPPQPASPYQPEAAFVPDPKRDEYQLIFTKIPEAEKVNRTHDSWDRWEYRAASFSEDLMRVGAQGYRLSSIAFAPQLAVLKRDDHQYEYAVIHISSRRQMFPNDPQFGLTYELWARKGFRVADYFVFLDWCENDTWNDGILAPANCTYSSTVVLERRINVRLPYVYDIVNGPLTFSRKKLEGELLEEIDNARQTNLYPTHMLTKSQLLRQSLSSVDDLAVADDEIEIVTAHLKKRVNALAQRGYRLIIRPLLLEAAVMRRKKGITNPASYIWIREKDIEQELARLQQQGAIYRMNYGCGTGLEMIFEQPSGRDGKQREYKVLAIELKQFENVAKGEIDFELFSGSQNGTDEFKRLTREGYVARDFFGCYLSNKKNRLSGFKILLERLR